MITIYHNPRCSKSRQGLALLEDSGKPFKVVKYLVDQLTVSELEGIISKLQIKPINLVRKNETIWKSDFKTKTLSEKQTVEAMVLHPKLIERPIVVNKNKAVVGRPTETILEII
ncbi:arsenate reductase (glutaredoxin) [uncultured Winogradskyella sp.]|mgnify:CR=1 FL=1|uniref:arsenate reductase (glutaredoxin) n=1 Tax=uncultured Winogradskyella sp. TaxID=395353 RepID=UPI0030D9CDFD|tara:strand:+ start:265572 stop:265913 length:342 start_codon:yes stop_codon:yes gene_type:complete